ncbi:MAG: carbohydrate ABC transporter permease, partial [Anaerolineaceae bacterium]|nr:carbohydrate ABC transporter permease [Anaerolineaceae bacterium]
ASQLDGATDLQYFLRVALPLSTPIIAVLCLFYAVGHWNQFFNALIYLTNAELFPLQTILRQILVQNQFDISNVSNVQDMLQRQGLRELLKYALIVITSVPVLLIYPFVQKHFVKGMLIGAIKG